MGIGRTSFLDWHIMEGTQVITFKGIRDDIGRKFAGEDYFHRCTNFVYDDLVGANKVKFPQIKFNSNTPESIDGQFEFKYINADSESVIEDIVVFGGSVFRGLFSSLTPVYTELTPGERCDFTVSNDRLFIVNGTDIGIIYDGEVTWQMGAPKAVKLFSSGNLDGEYFYEMTLTIGGVESRSGSVSNTISTDLNEALLDIPIGPADVEERTIYRSAGNGLIPKLLTVIADNTTTEFLDNIPDGNLGVDIIDINDPMPITEFITVSFDKLVGCSSKLRPHRLYFTDPNKEFFTETRNALNVSTFGNDNTPLKGMEIDYNQIVVGSERFLYLVDVSGDLGIVKQTNENIGVKDGYAMITVPANEEFEGGIIFPSTLNDFRLFNGNISIKTDTALDNLRSFNISQVIRGTLKNDLETAKTIAAVFSDYKYLVAINQNIYSFDIRGQKWSRFTIRTSSFSSTPYSFGLFNGRPFIGQKDEGIVEEMFLEYTYRGETYDASLSSNQVMAGTDLKYFQKFFFYFTTASDCELKITVIVEGNINDSVVKTVTLKKGSFSNEDFFTPDFSTLSDDEDYEMMYINKYGRWIEFRIDVLSGIFNFRGFKIIAKPTTTK